MEIRPPVRQKRCHSTSTLLESQANSQFLTVNSISGTNHPTDKGTSKDDSKAYPIPPRRTKKFTKLRSKSSSVLSTFKEDTSSQESDKGQVGSTSIVKRPLGQQLSNPVPGSSRVKPPRPPPPVWLVPPRTFTQMDVPHSPKGGRKKSASPAPVVIDTRARRRRHSDLPLPQPPRPPLPYEVFVCKPVSGKTESKPEVSFEENLTLPYKEIATAKPVDYEVFVTTSGHLSNCSSPSDISEEESSKISSNSKADSEPPLKGNVQTSSLDDLNKESSCFIKDKQEVTNPHKFTKQTDNKVEQTEEEVSKDSEERELVSMPEVRNKEVKSDNGIYSYALVDEPFMHLPSVEQEDWKEEEGAGSEPIYIEMNPTVFIPPPKNYRPKKYTKIKDTSKR